MLRFALPVALALALSACGQAPVTPSQAPASRLAAQSEADTVAPVRTLAPVKLDDTRLTPESVEAKARETAAAWQADAELRFVGWGVLKFELLSAVSHVFYSPSADEVLVVKTFMREKWQSGSVYDQAVVTKPAGVLQPLDAYKIGASRALKLARKHHFGWKTVSLVTLSQPQKLPFAFWGVIGNGTVVLVHANTGQSLSPRGVDPFPKEWTK